MNYEYLLIDFTARTRSNLEALRKLKKDQPEAEIYEVTQLINSMLGFIVLPWERVLSGIRETAAAAQGEPASSPDGIKDLSELRYIRNAIAHFNIEFLTNERNEISGIRVWNDRNGGRNWEKALGLDELEAISQMPLAALRRGYPENTERL